MMEHLNYSERLKEHRSGIDYRRTGSALDRLAHSELVLCLLARQLHAFGIAKEKATICLFGSTARGEFDVRWSDIDVIFVGFSTPERNDILRVLATYNPGLDFHGAIALLDSNNEEANSRLDLRFPCVSSDSLLSPDGLARRMQFLFEAKPIFGRQFCEELLVQIVRYYGLEQRPKLRTAPERLLTELDAFYKKLESESANEVEKMSDFFAKHFMVRQCGQHLTRLALMAAIYSKKDNYNSSTPSLAFAHILRQPNLLRLFFWNETKFVTGRTMSLLESSYPDDLLKMLKNILPGSEASAKNARLASAQAVFNEIVQTAAKQYSDTMDLLYSEESRNYIQNKDPNVLMWETDVHLRRITDQCKSFRETMICLGTAIGAVYNLATETAVLQKPFHGRTGLQTAIDSFLAHLQEKTS